MSRFPFPPRRPDNRILGIAATIVVLVAVAWLYIVLSATVFRGSRVERPRATPHVPRSTP